RIEQDLLRQAQARLAELRAGAPLTEPFVPLGFQNSEEFTQFGRTIQGGLRANGIYGAQSFLRGSAVTGRSFNSGEPFDLGRRSDLDVALASPVLFRRAAELGIPMRGGGTRTEPLSDEQLKQLGLLEMADRLRQQVDRPLTFMIYSSRGAIAQRGP